MSRQQLPYGAWPSPITAERAARASLRLAEPFAFGDATTWIERRPDEGGRYVVVRSDAGSEPYDLTPPGWSARTRVHEYGGGSYTVAGDLVFFTNDEDQRIYRQARGGDPAPITPAAPTQRGTRYADLDV